MRKSRVPFAPTAVSVCGQLIFHKDGKLISIEGDPESPISQGNLCPKGAASYQLLTHDRRETK